MKIQIIYFLQSTSHPSNSIFLIQTKFPKNNSLSLYQQKIQTMKNANDFRIGVIYKYTSPSGKCYIGQTINELSRKTKHKSETIKAKTKFGNALRKYGFDNFTYEVLIKFKPHPDKLKIKRVLDKLEKRYILLYDSMNNGYNLNKGGEGNIGYAHSPETIAIIKEASIKQWSNEENCKAQSERLKGISKPPHSPERILQQKASAKNKKSVIKIISSTEYIEFESINSAAESLGGESKLKTRANKITECCNGTRSSYLGFMWEFKVE